MRSMWKPMLGIILVSIAGTLSAQPAIEWQRTYGGSGSDQAFQIAQMPDGGYIVAGQTTSTDGNVQGLHGAMDIWVIRIDGQGELLWQRCLGGSNDDWCRDMVATNDGGVSIVGSTESTDGDIGQSLGSRDIWVVTLSSLGDIVWERSLGGSGFETGVAIDRTSNGDLYILGQTNSLEIPNTHGMNNDYYLARSGANGELIQERCFGGSGNESPHGMDVVNEGTIVLSGVSGSRDGDVLTNGITNAWVVACDQELTILWQRIIEDNGAQSLVLPKAADDGVLHIAGTTTASQGETLASWGARDVFITRLDGSGPLQGSASFGGGEDESVWCLLPAPWNGMTSIGSSMSGDGLISDPNGGQDAWVFSVDANLELRWERSFGGSEDDGFVGACPTMDGGTALVGFSHSMDGDLTNNQGGRDLWVVKLDPVEVGVPDQQAGFTLTLAPNPAQDQLRITWSRATAASLTVHDALGQVVHSQNVSAAMGQLNLPVEAWAPGLYTISLQDATRRRSERFVKE